jgi:hypothetical protein
VVVGELRERREVEDLQQRVRGGLRPHHPGGRPDRRPDGVEVGEVDRGDLDPPAGVDLRDLPPGAAVDVVGHHDVVARGEQPEHRVLGGEARGEAHRRVGVLEGGEARPARAVRVGLPVRAYS